jgi:hypothetical protein
MSAAHVFKLEEFSLYHQNMFIRDAKGEIFKISRVNKYSSLRDMIIFELESYPKKVYPLRFSNEIAIGYEAKVIDWLEYFSLDKSLLPRSFKNSEMKMDNDQFEFNFDNFKLSLSNNKINNQSNIHFHFGYSNKHLIDEDLLLFELFPNKAVKSHFRIEKNLSPSEFSTDKYKNKWNEIENLTGDYSGKLIKKEGTFMIKKVIEQTKKEIATELNQIYVVGCIHNTMNENIESNCNHFSKGVTFY